MWADKENLDIFRIIGNARHFARKPPEPRWADFENWFFSKLTNFLFHRRSTKSPKLKHRQEYFTAGRGCEEQWNLWKCESAGRSECRGDCEKNQSSAIKFREKNYKSKVAFEQTSSLLNLKISGVPQQPQREEEVDKNKQAEE